MLNFIFFLIIFILFFSVSCSLNYIRISYFFLFSFCFLYLLILLFFFNKSIFFYQLVFDFLSISFFNIYFSFGIDILSILLVFLSNFSLIFCLFIYWYLRYKISFYLILLFISSILFFNVFFSIDFFSFHISFEAIVIPMFLLIGIWGSRERKIYASYQLFLYTLLGSILLLFCFSSFYLNKGSIFFDFILYSLFFQYREFLLWIFLFIGFAVKIPIIPLHIWLPEAHVEAPTPGSVILAGILLKLGTYAMFRFLVTFFSNILEELIFFIFNIALLSMIYSSLVALNQIDIKKIVAYSSISHMNFALFGIFREIILGLTGAFFIMLAHAITSSFLFLGIGVLYERYKTRLIFYFGGLVNFMPIFASLYFFGIISNFGFPGTFNFISEFLILCGAFTFSHSIILISSIGIFSASVYSLFFLNKIFFGLIPNFFIRFYSDCNRFEFLILINFICLILFFGIFPNFLINYIIIFLLKIDNSYLF